MSFEKVRKHKVLTALVISFVATLGVAAWLFYNFMHVPLPAIAKPASPPPFSADAPFMVGVNYPWNNYGGDFGNNASWGHHGVSTFDGYAQVDRDFAYLQSIGIKNIRWFLFCDGRSGLVLDDTGKVVGLDFKVRSDMDAALEIAKRHDIKIIFVLVDFSIFNSRHRLAKHPVSLGAELAEDKEHRDAFIENAVTPILKRYGANENILAWEVVNEPEWAMNIRGGRSFRKNVSVEAMQAFVNQTVDAIHANTKQLATVGSARRDWLKYWRNSNLDFYQYHYYPNQEWLTPFDRPIAELGLDKPCIVGEFPTKDPGRTVGSYLEASHKNGLAGAFAWGLRSSDRYSNLRTHARELHNWRPKPQRRSP